MSAALSFPASRIQVIHAAVPGRVRLHVPALKRKPRTAERLRAALAILPGVASVEVSTVTANLLVEYDPAHCGLRNLGDCIRACLGPSTGRATETPSPSDPRPAPTAAATPSGRPRELYLWASEAPVEAVLRRLGVPGLDGLLSAEVERRSAKARARAFPPVGRRRWADILREQFVSVPTLMLGAAMLVSYFTASRVDALVIGAVLALNGAIGAYTERYAESAIEALRKLGHPQAHVVRGGKRLTTAAENLVEGDILRLRAGDLVPADARVIEGTLLVDEAMLTGESEPVHKQSEALARPEAPRHVWELGNLLFQGTAVLDGRARAVVLATGRDTELGRIQSLVSGAVPPRTQLQEQLDGLGKSLGIGATGFCGGLFGIGLARGQSLLHNLQTAVSLAVSAVPEGLPAVATTALAAGMKRMLGQKVIIRKLPAVEALGSVTVLCVDKTGTLTHNRMTASRYWHEGRQIHYRNGGEPGRGCFKLEGKPLAPQAHPALDAMLRVGALCNEAKLRRERGGLHISGSATEGALLLAAQAGGYPYKELRRRYPQALIHRRNEHHLRMASVHEDPAGGLFVAVKGSPEAVLELCTARMLPDGTRAPLTPRDREWCRQANREMSEDGLRVLGFACGRKPGDSLHNGHLEELTWLGLVGLEDPIRSGVAESIRRCRQAGVRTVILTGDQRGTALAVARALELDNGYGQVMEAPDLEGMTPEEVARTVEQTAVYARVSPEDKLRIVQALQAAGHVVAMTGDGINDGPALKAADIGIAMGEGSSDVARELADVVLTRNDFEGLVTAVEQGRVIFANIRRTLRYLVASNISELLLAGVTLLARIPFPFQPIQILWLNLVSDVFPALALVLEPSDRDVMRDSPRKPGTPLLGRADWGRLGADAAVIGSSTLCAYLWAARRYGFGPLATAVAFTAMTVGEAFYALSCGGRSAEPGRGSHGALAGSTVGVVGLQLAVNHWEPLRRLLHGAALGRADYLVALTAAALPAAWAAARKHILSDREPRALPFAVENPVVPLGADTVVGVPVSLACAA